jgi:ATP-dependent helicase/nuclease subunit A
MTNTIDASIRERALNPGESFIVQAPAGSGKTELLTQRYLTLLGQACQAPEEIIAITFTRKAAAQMRERVLTALQLAQESPPADAHRQTTWQAAHQALDKDQQYQWHLLDNPQRLRILTIDALCSQLCHRQPVLAGYGGWERIVEDAAPYYATAIREWMQKNTPKALLTHLDNNAQQLQTLCSQLLARREQWLPYIAGQHSPLQLRIQMEQGLKQLAEEILQAAQAILPPHLSEQLLPLLHFAGALHWRGRRDFPAACAGELEAWQSLVKVLLTTKGELRKTIDARQGFPPKTPEKTSLLKILAEIADHPTLCEHLRQIQQCPPLCYEESQWQIVLELLEALPLLAAQLQLIFCQRGVMDFVEVGLSASRALGEEQQPTDLALALDYQIRHLLVDEFQDTSVAQFKLLEKLLLGWEVRDGRSIFLVGDPMQSIYRFRNAEVSLFLRTIRSGMQNIRLTPLVLTQNFRSGDGLITWFNQVFPHILPSTADLTCGAIPYTPAVAAQAQTVTPPVSCYASTDSAHEAQQLIEIIQRLRRQYPGQKIAILVRSRPHLQEIVPALQAAHISFQAVEIASLSSAAEIQDLAALTRALQHRADRLAWLSVLRAPYCGLTLADLHCIAQASERRTIYETLLNFSQLTRLSDDARQRLTRIVPVLSQAVFHSGRWPLAEWVEETWLSLGGPAGLRNAAELQNAQTYFQWLREFEQNQRPLEKLYAAADPRADDSLQIMTIHKAKGLEFDHVILPALERASPSESHSLLLWMERANANGGSNLILAPMKAAAAESDPIYTYIKQTEQQKLQYEAERLLYVAATRAKQSLHLLAVLPAVPDLQTWRPRSGSFLAMLWPYFREQLAPIINTQMPAEESAATTSTGFLHRLTADWRLPPTVDGRELVFETATLAQTAPMPVPLLNLRASRIGTVIHEALADLAEKSPHFPSILENKRWGLRLLHLGIARDDLAAAEKTVQEALQNTLRDPRGLWILSAEHLERHNEYALSALLNNQLVHIVIDRTFVDAAGIRWIIDYKTGHPDDTELSAYRAQLERYAAVVQLFDSRPIRLGLYFPLTGHWQEL